MPCNSVATDTNTLSKPNLECNHDLDAQIKYLGPSNWLFLTNQERFNPEAFGEDAIEHYSTIMNQ